MKKPILSHQIIAIFLTLIFLPSVIPINQVFANNNGPGSPEAAGFEPVEATDMVNLTNGNMTYTMPLFDINGYPLNLSYHAGISPNLDASWAGLGWYLNPGSINRATKGTPDDWKSGVGINFTSYNESSTYHSITAGVGVMGSSTQVAIGANWGNGQGLSGSIQASSRLTNFYADTRGNISGGVGFMGNSVSFGNNQKPSYSVGYGGKIGNSGMSGSFSYSDDGTISLGVSGGNSGVGMSFNGSGNFSIGGNHSSGAGGSFSSSSTSESQGDATIKTESIGINVVIPVAPPLDLRLGLGKQKVDISIKKGYKNQKWGALYSNESHYTNNAYSYGDPLINSINNASQYKDGFYDYMVRQKQMDFYSTKLPQPEKEFIGDYSQDIENINFTYLAYDDYNVASQGMMGNLTPRMFQNINVVGKGDFTTNEEGDDIHVFWHHGDGSKKPRRSLESNSLPFEFYFDGQYAGTETNDAIALTNDPTTSLFDLNNFVYVGDHYHNGIGYDYSSSNPVFKRAHQANYVEVYTNSQIANGNAPGLITPKNIPDHTRNNSSDFDPNGIGGYKITAADGKTYHYSIPVYHYERVRRNQIEGQEYRVSGPDYSDFPGFEIVYEYDCKNVNEVRDYTRYATHWLLTAITGSDYVDRPDPSTDNQTGTFNKEDYGYWLEFEYGKWSDGFVWRSPYQDFVYDYNTDLTGNVGVKDKGYYQFGRKQIYYLNRINSKEKTALFVKDIRYDGFGKALTYRFHNLNNPGIGVGNSGDNMSENSLRFTDPNVEVREDEVSYKREYVLKLDKIVIIDNEDRNLIDEGGESNLGTNLPNYNPIDTVQPGWNSLDFKQHYNPNSESYSYGIHQEQNVLDVGDIPENFIENHGLKTIKFNHSYRLVEDTPSSKIENYNNQENPTAARLTLDSLEIKGRGNISFMPPTSFTYYEDDDIENPNFQPVDAKISQADLEAHIETKNNSLDPWGYMQGEYLADDGEYHSRAEIWSLKSIQTPTGATINVDYEEDDYWTEAFSRRYWQKNLSLVVTRESEDNFKVRFKNNLAVDPSRHVEDFNDYFEIDERVFLDLYLCHMRDEWGSVNDRGAVDIREDDIVTVEDIYYETNSNGISEQILLLDVQDTGANPLNENNTVGVYGDPIAYLPLGRNYHDDPHPRNEQLSRGECPSDNDENRYNLLFKLLANKVPEDETGGGLRVKEIETTDPLDNTVYHAEYDYTNPNNDKSSGITSYAPVNGLKYVPYQSEIPPPGVMYEYVTMKETDENGNFNSKTRYRHHVLKPIFNIFNPNIEMELESSNGPNEDKLFWANVEENSGGFDGNNSKKIEAKKIDINVNSALFGQIKSIEILNPEGHIINKIENEYINGSYLGSGYVRETFNSMKSIFKSNGDGTTVYDNETKRLLSISSKTEYKNLLKKTISTSGNSRSSIEYFDLDPWLGSYRKSVSKTAQNDNIISYKIPAYEKYPEMGSKVLNPSNHNMLTQEAMNITKFKNEGSNVDHTLSASISTWDNDWTYRDEIGNSYNESGIYRKQKNYVWKDDVHTYEIINGVSSTEVDENNSFFNWNTNTPISDKWQLASEVTRYSHWSMPIETKDINDNFASSKLADNYTKVIASGNARYTEMYYSGAEFVASGNTFEGEVKGANYRTNQFSHTGDYSVKTDQAYDPVFEVSGSVGSDENDFSQDFRPGTYKVSFWTRVNGLNEGTLLTLNSDEIEHSETVMAGCWKMYNYYVDLQPNSNFDLQVTNSHGTGYFDDFRMHPVYASMNTYVYDSDTDDLTYILDNNNMGSAFRYDSLGRLKTTYTEVMDSQSIEGGFKVAKQYKMHYQNTDDVLTNYDEDINDCTQYYFKPLSYDGPYTSCKYISNPYDLPFKVDITSGSGNYKYEWSWLTDISNNTFSPWVESAAEENIPYAIKYCDDNYFNKIWEVKVRVTDLETDEVIVKHESYTEPLSECDNYIENDKVLLGVESNRCHGLCNITNYTFELYPLDSNLQLDRTISYTDNNTGKKSSLDLESSKHICPKAIYVPSSSCESGYVKYVNLSPSHSGSIDYSYEFYLDCVSEEEVLNNAELKNDKHESRYAMPGLSILKVEGEIYSVKDNTKK